MPQAKTEGVLSDWQDTHAIRPDTNLSACCSFRHGLRRATFLREEGFGFTRHLILSLPLGEMSRSDREGWLPREGAGLPLCSKTEGVLQIDKIRMRLALMQTYPRAALSVICFANASSPKGRAEKPERTAHMPHQAISCADLPAYRSFPRLR